MDEGANNKDIGRSPRVLVASLGRILEERRLPHCHCSVDDVGVHPKCWEALPFPVLLVPQILNSGVANFSDGYLSLSPLTPRGWPATLVIRGLLKIGCLRTSGWEVGSIFIRPTLTFNQDPNILFQKDQVVFWSLGVVKNQLMS